MKIYIQVIKHLYLFYLRNQKIGTIALKFVILFLLVSPIFIFREKLHGHLIEPVSSVDLILAWIVFKVLWSEQQSINLIPYLNLPIKKIHLVIISQTLDLLKTKSLILFFLVSAYFYMNFNNAVFVMFILFAILTHLTSFALGVQSIKFKSIVLIMSGLLWYLLKSIINFEKLATSFILGFSEVIICIELILIFLIVGLLTKYFNRFYLS